MEYQSINPATGELIETFPELNDRQLDQKLETSEKTYRQWRKSPFAERSEKMLKAADLLRSNTHDYGKIISTEMGKPISQAKAEVEKCALVCEYYANEGPAFLSPRIIPTDADRSYVQYDPLGPIFAIMPWNFPFWQVFRFAAPNLMAGNTGILKHAPNVPRSAKAIEEIFLEAGFPEGAFLNLYISNEQAAKVISDYRIQGVTLTGSDRAGRAVAQTAGQSLKKSVLELGGSDPFIILPDADIAKAAEIAAISRNQNSGQSCIAAKRFIVDHRVMDSFNEHFTRQLRSLKMGNPMDPEVQIGPMARDDLRKELHDQVQRSAQTGATVSLGGEIPSGNGFFYPVTLLTGANIQTVSAKEETFGPVSTVIGFDQIEQAIDIANNIPYGLGASLWTEDLDLAAKIAGEIEAGSVFVNAMVKSDVRLPFGGIKQSGYGRELSEEGIREFVNIKTVLMNSK